MGAITTAVGGASRAGSGFTPWGLGLQAAGTLFGLFTGNRMVKEADRELKKVNPTWVDYQTSQAAKDMSGMTRAQLFSRNPAIAKAQRGVTANMAAALGSINRNSNDGATNIAATVGALSQADANMGDIADKQFAMDQNAMANWMKAQDVLVGEDKVKNQNMIQKYMLDMQRKSELEQMKQAGRQTMLGGFSQGASSLFNAQMMKQRAANPLAFTGY